MRETAQSSLFACRYLPVVLLLAAGPGRAQAGDAPLTTIEPAADSMLAIPVTTPPGSCSQGVTVPEKMIGIWKELERLEAQGRTPPEAPLAAQADRMALERDGVSRLEGNVWLQQGGQFISTEVLEFNESTGVVRTLAPARFGSRELLVDSETAVYDTRIGEGRFENTEFHLLGRSGRGDAEVLAKTGESTARMTGVKYTTCPPDDEDWWLKASSMNLDQEAGMGVGRNVRIAFMGVPFFYTPWISFPIDGRRKTGFLFPEFGDSGRHGPWLRLPYYLNLAPNLDATLTPYYMTDRGTMLQSQFRYLFDWGAGELDADYLDNDRLTDAHRYRYAYRHSSVLPADWQFALSYQQVSDEEYFQDFSDSGRANLVSHLAQVATLSRMELEYGVMLRMQRFQTIDPTIPESNRPYDQWPAVSYYYTPQAFGDWLWFELEGNSVNFQRDGRLSGWRHHTETAFSTDFGDPGLRATPRIAWWQTEYDLEEADGTVLEISRGLPVASLDVQARLLRPLDGGGSQTLEPRLFYLHVPFREQNDIPRFDTGVTTDTLGSLFQENRFTGTDRVGDMERVSLGLESALVGPDGREWFSAAVARAWYADDRQVQLTDSVEPDTETASNYYGTVEYRPAETQSFWLDVSWDPDTEKTDFGSLQYQFKPADFTVLNVAYRYRRLDDEQPVETPLEQVDVSFATPVGGRWGLFGRSVYSIDARRSQETLAGFEYENCCWIFRAFNRRYIFNREGEFDQSIWFQLELKGLSSVGRRIDEFLEDDIYGYGETP